MSTHEESRSRCPHCGATLESAGFATICPACLFGDAELFAAQSQPRADGESIADGLLPPEINVVGEIPGYQILGTVARGGMGVVYRARQINLGRVVALKVMLGGIHARDSFKERFLREARLAARLKHPAIVPIHDVGEHGGQPYFSMEYVEGGDLAQEKQAGRVTPQLAARYVATLARAVQFAHENGVLHRDLKPSNLLLGQDGRLWVTDFGLAREFAADSELTLSGDTLGSPGYLPPEQVSVRHGKVGPWSDVYGLGATLFHLLTGQPPVQGGTVADTLRRVLEEDVRFPKDQASSIEPDLQVICLRCLEKNPDRRYSTAAAVADELDRFLKGEPIHARPVSAVERWGRIARRRPAITALAGALILAIGMGIAVGWTQFQQRRQQETEVATKRVANTLRAVTDGLAADQAAEAIRLLATRLRESPDSSALADRLIQLVDERVFLVPVPTNTIPAAVSGLAGDDYTHRVATGHGGRLRAEATNDVEVVIQDGTERRPVLHLKGIHAQFIRSVSFSEDGTKLVTGAADGMARVWEVPSGRLVHTLHHPKSVLHAVFHPNGRLVATGCSDGAVRFWSLDSPEPRPHVLTVHPQAVGCVRFSPEGRWLAVGTDAGTVRLWDVATGAPASEVRDFRDLVVNLEFLPDASLLHVRLDRLGSCLVRPSTRHLLKSIRQDQPTAEEGPMGRPAPESLLDQLPLDRGGSSLLTLDGRTLAVAVESQVLLFDGLRKKSIAEPLLHADAVRLLSFSRDGRRLATGTRAGRVRVWDVRAGQPVSEEWRCDFPLRKLVFDREGRVLMTDDDRWFWDLAASGDVPPHWLPELAELLVGPDAASPEDLRPDALRERFLVQLRRQAADTELTHWVARLLGLPSVEGGSQ